MRGLDGLALGIGKERMSVHATRIAAGSASADPGHVHTAVCSTVASWLVSLVTRFRASRDSTHARLSSGGSRGLQTLSVYFSGFRLHWPPMSIRTPVSSRTG